MHAHNFYAGFRTRYVIGIDEAGCGPLAGPVVVAGVMVNAKRKTPMLRGGAAMEGKQGKKLFEGIRDSKKLSAKQREEWFGFLTEHPDIAWAATAVSPKVIDRINIRQAAILGARRVYARLTRVKSIERRGGIDDMDMTQYPVALLDGGLFLARHIPQETIIKGDERIPIISAASIIAKVTRDRMMLRLHQKYPQYRFDLHKGYGTALHREMIREFGRSDIHRASFRCHN
ncbi:MAG: ribonuclease HII [Patescibacteria group bacterium]